MTQENNLTARPINPATLAKRMLLGGGIALIFISVFLLGVDEPNPAWPKFWMVRPLLIVTLAGATGGLIYYVMNHVFYYGWKKAFAVVISLIVYIIGLWIGFVLGLVGTLWD